MKHELLAPAGNLEAGYAALYYGADAVYLGLTRFSARAGAENFTAEELDEFVAYAHSLKRKVFVALNTILSEAEINELPEIFAILRRTAVDALIVQDLGVAYLAKRLLPEVELHASTQMAVHNAAGARFLQTQGFKRVVLARELSLVEIKAIAAAVPGLDLEVFIHGALCYSYSGQCLFSALEYGKSANRGRCVYPCRSLYKSREIGASGLPAEASLRSGRRAVLEEADEQHFSLGEQNSRADGLRTHLFSMKDLALEEAVREIPALSLKIEGRKKSPLYVAAVTNYYRHILDGQKKDLCEAEDIKQIFSRPWCRFHFGSKDKNVTDEQFVGHRGLLIGQIERVGKGRIGLRTSHALARYDGVQIDAAGDEKPFGFGVKAMFVGNKPVIAAQAGQYVELELPSERPHLPLGAPVYLASSSAVKGKYGYTKPKPGSYRHQQALDITVEIGATEVWAMCDGAAVSAAGHFTAAKEAARVVEAAREAFGKTGGTAFCLGTLTVHNPAGLFVPVSVLNDLRRRLLAAAAAEQASGAADFVWPRLENAGAYQTARPQALKCFFADMNTKPEEVPDMASYWIVLPQICRQTEKLAAVIKRLYDAGARQFVAENYYAFELLRAYQGIQIGAGSFLYVMNRYAVAALKEMGAAWATLALESSAENMEAVVQQAVLPMAQVVKAYPPLFTSAVCLRPNACQNCVRGTKRYLLQKDGKEYVAVSKDCQMQLFAKERYERDAVGGIAYFYESSEIL